MSSRKPNYGATSRLKAFADALFARQADWPLSDAAKVFEVHPRTIKNWVRALGQLYSVEGAPGVTLRTVDGRRVIHVHPEAIGLSPRETDLASLTLAAQALGFVGDNLIHDGLRRITGGLQVTPDAAGRFVADARLMADLPRKLAVFSWGAYQPPDKAVVNEIIRALLANHRLRIRQEGEKGGQKVEPLTLAAYKSGLFLIARSAGEKRAWHVPVSWLAEAKDLGPKEAFRYPSAWSPAEYRGKKFGLLGGTPMHVRLRFDAHLFEYLKERSWHPTQRIERLADGSVRFSMDVEKTIELVAWICAFGDEVVAEGPAALRNEVGERLRRAAGRYGAGV